VLAVDVAVSGRGPAVEDDLYRALVQLLAGARQVRDLPAVATTPRAPVQVQRDHRDDERGVLLDRDGADVRDHEHCCQLQVFSSGACRVGIGSMGY
jgi:hypothetical protein